MELVVRPEAAHDLYSGCRGWSVGDGMVPEKMVLRP